MRGLSSWLVGVAVAGAAVGCAARASSTAAVGSGPGLALADGAPRAQGGTPSPDAAHGKASAAPAKSGPGPAPTGMVARLSDAELDAQIAGAHKLAFPERVQQLSKLFLGVPYGEFPLGEGSGVEPQARWRVDAVDCQTYVETVLAMSNARSLAEARSVLDDIRYGKSEISFATRNHFTEAQWLPANSAKGYLREDTAEVEPDAPTTTLVLKREQWSQVPGLQRLRTADIPDGSFAIRYLTLDQARARAARIAPGSILLVVREADPKRVVRVTHMGLVVRGAHGLAVRHASFGAEHKVIEEDFAAFLERQRTFKKWKVAGVALARPLDASERVERTLTPAR